MDVRIKGMDRRYLDGDSFDFRGPLAFTLPGVMPSAECERLIERIEALGPDDAPVSTAAGIVMRPDVRNNKRVMFDDEELARALFDRVAASLPASLCEMKPVGLNERFRCYRYEPGQRFAPHRDGSFERSREERSLMTFMVYLNDGFSGGETTFLDYDEVVIPSTGSALLFQHMLVHEGSVVRTGVKYVLRSDVMFRA